MLDYYAIKMIHVGSVILSGSGFALRGLLMLAGSRALNHPVTRILPHVVDTILLASALALMMISRQYPTHQPWVAAKIAALVAYIVLGSIALKRGRSAAVRGVAFAFALATFAYIVRVALTRDPLPF